MDSRGYGVPPPNLVQIQTGPLSFSFPLAMNAICPFLHVYRRACACYVAHAKSIFGKSHNMRLFLPWLKSLIVTAALVLICYFWLDRPIALWVHGNIRSHYQELIAWFQFPDPLIPIALVILMTICVRAIIARPLPKYQIAALLCSVSILGAEFLKKGLKFVFGRTWPETIWPHNNLSLIRDDVYGFHFFHRGYAYHSFPSGHMAAVCAAAAVLWIWYPRFRPVWIIGALVVGTALVGGNYHFLGDVIAGAFVGVTSAAGATAVWQNTPLFTPLSRYSPDDRRVCRGDLPDELS